MSGLGEGSLCGERPASSGYDRPTPLISKARQPISGDESRLKVICIGKPQR